MRKITRQAVDAFMNGEPFNLDNTQVMVMLQTYPLIHLRLHGNVIAERYKHDNEWVIKITNAGWFSATTKERLNGLPGVRIHQKAGVWYLNGVKWSGEWIAINGVGA